VVSWRAALAPLGRSFAASRLSADRHSGQTEGMDTNTKTALAVGTAFIAFLLAFVLLHTFLMIS